MIINPNQTKANTMKKTFSTLKYGDKYQIVIVGVDWEDKEAITDFLREIIRADESEDHSKVMVPGKKKWEE